MKLHVIPLRETWFSILNLAGLGLESWRYASLDSQAVVDAERDVLFVQLGASTYEAKDGDYRYLLQISTNIYIISWFEHGPRLLITDDPSAKNWTGNYGQPLEKSVEVIANEAYKLLYKDNSGVRLTEQLLGADGKPISSWYGS